MARRHTLRRVSIFLSYLLAYTLTTFEGHLSYLGCHGRMLGYMDGSQPYLQQQLHEDVSRFHWDSLWAHEQTFVLFFHGLQGPEAKRVYLTGGFGFDPGRWS